MKATIAYVASNCGAANNRDQYVLELMKYLPVDSYGRCVHNKVNFLLFPQTLF